MCRTQLDFGVLRQQNVLALDVSMDDVVGVEVGETLRERVRERARE